MLREFSEKQHIPYPLLSDLGSEVIRRFGILNDQIEEADLFLYGIPFPGSYVVDEDGVVVAKFFHDTYKKRDSPEVLIDAALGRVELSEDTPRAAGGDPEVKITAAIQGGKGSFRQGMIRHLVVRFDLGEGLHIYGEPVPDGMMATSIEVQGPPGLVVGEAVLPPTEPLRLESMDVDLNVWSGQVDIVVPLYAVGELQSETRPLDGESTPIDVTVRYQACDDQVCLLPRTEKLSIEVPLDVIDIPSLGMHKGHGQREGNYDGTPHLRRLLLRSAKRNPLNVFRFLWKNLKLERAAARRRRSGRRE